MCASERQLQFEGKMLDKGAETYHDMYRPYACALKKFTSPFAADRSSV